jgi:high-affinity Fe2+/Pb2+ permease
MKGPLFRFSAATVSFARLLEAVFNLGLALVFAWIVLWLSLSFGLNWLIIILDIILGLSAAQLFVKACTVYSTSQTQERPDERERYLQSRSLYNPGSRREAGRRERES